MPRKRKKIEKTPEEFVGPAVPAKEEPVTPEVPPELMVLEATLIHLREKKTKNAQQQLERWAEMAKIEFQIETMILYLMDNLPPQSIQLPVKFYTYRINLLHKRAAARKLEQEEDQLIEEIKNYGTQISILKGKVDSS